MCSNDWQEVRRITAGKRLGNCDVRGGCPVREPMSQTSPARPVFGDLRGVTTDLVETWHSWGTHDPPQCSPRSDRCDMCRVPVQGNDVDVVTVGRCVSTTNG